MFLEKLIKNLKKRSDRGLNMCKEICTVSLASALVRCATEKMCECVTIKTFYQYDQRNVHDYDVTMNETMNVTMNDTMTFGKLPAQNKFSYLTPAWTPCDNAKKMCGIFDLRKVGICLLTLL